MGLDMNLRRRTNVKNYSFQDKELHKVTVKRDNKIVKEIKPERISEIVEDVACWRKANAIHAWFVKNVQNNEDNCADYYVSIEDIVNLKETIDKVLKSCELIDGKVIQSYTLGNEGKIPNYMEGKIIKDPTIAKELLPTENGFFFGGTEYDEDYYNDLAYTLKVCNEIIEEGDFGYLYYSSSW